MSHGYSNNKYEIEARKAEKFALRLTTIRHDWLGFTLVECRYGAVNRLSGGLGDLVCKNVHRRFNFLPSFRKSDWQQPSSDPAAPTRRPVLICTFSAKANGAPKPCFTKSPPKTGRHQRFSSEHRILYPP